MLGGFIGFTFYILSRVRQYKWQLGSVCDGLLLSLLLAVTMGITPERKMSSVFDRLGKKPPVSKKTCVYWLQGRCNKNHCRFVHSESQAPKSEQQLSHQLKPSNGVIQKRSIKITRRNPNPKRSADGDNGLHGSIDQKQEPASRKMAWRKSNHSVDGDNAANVLKHTISDLFEQKKGSKGSKDKNTQPRQCEFWIKDSCVKGDKCESLHAWSYGSGLTQLAKLEGHNKAITGIALPSGSTKLYTASKDKCVHAWDCYTGQCAGTEYLNDEVGCIITKGPWLFSGFPNSVKAWNLQHKIGCSLDAIGGQVQSLEFDNDILFAGMEDGNILVWRWNSEANDFELAATLNGHNGHVYSLVVGSGHGKLYSGSGDCSIKVWDQNLKCVQTLDGHTREVTSLLCWDRYLFSASLDKTLKVWCANANGTMEMMYEHKEEHGLIALGGIMDQPEAKHILLCSLEDKSVRLYELPTFVERGRVFSKERAPMIQVGVDGLFFIGDGTGEVLVWRFAGVPQPLER